MSKNTDKILVALDGSKKSLKTIEYLCRFKPFLEKKLVLLNVITKVPEYYYDLKKEPFSHEAASRVRAWEFGHKAEIKAFMEESRMKLIASGFRPEAIEILITDRQKGIARDILKEAQKGYHALLLRRRGRGALLSIVLGSVSKKVVEKATTLPVMLSGVQPVAHSLLIAIDGSEGSKRAVEFTAKTVQGSDCRIVLCSVLRNFEFTYKEVRSQKLPDRVQSAYHEIEKNVQQAKEILTNAGVKSQKIVPKIVKDSKSRAGSIIEAVLEEKCDTVILGRKGKSEVPEFDIGRVPWKVIHGANQMNVWIIP